MKRFVKSSMVIITLCITYFAHASFTLSNDTIIQSGTDVGLTGLSNISGVVTSSYGSGVNLFTVYEIPHKITVNGNWTANLGRSMIIFNQISRSEILNISDTGVLNFEATNTFGGFTTNYQQGQIIFALTSNSSWSRREINLIGSGQMILKNITLKGVFSPWLAPNASGLVLWEDVIIDKEGSSGDIQTNIHGNKENVTFRRVKIYADGRSGITFRDNVQGNGSSAVMENVEIFQARDAWNNESGDRLIIKGLVPNLGSTVDVSQWATRETKIINAVDGSNFLWGGHLGNSTNNRGRVTVFQNISARLLNTDRVGIENARFYMQDNPLVASTNHTIPEDGLLANVQRFYNFLSDSNGDVAEFEVLIAEGIRTNGGTQISTNPEDNWVRPRGVNVDATTSATNTITDDVFNWASVSYNYNITNGQVALKGGENGAAVSVISLAPPDTSISETNQTVAAAYTGIAVDHIAQTITISENRTLCELYDFVKADKLNNLNFPTSITLATTPAGNELQIGDYQLIISGTTVLDACDKFGGIRSNVASSLNDPLANLGIALTDANGTYKLIQLLNVTNANITITDENSNTLLTAATNFTGTFNFATISNSNNVSISVTRSGFSNWGNDLDLTTADTFSFIVSQSESATGLASLDNQESAIFLLHKVLQKAQLIQSIYNNSDVVDLTMNSVNQPTATDATQEKQEEMLNLLKRILGKIQAVQSNY